MDQFILPAELIPAYRTTIAIKNGVERNLLFKTWGGLGDEICAEPTLRYALKSFKGCDVSLAAERPELFTHLDFKRVFDLKQERPVLENYLAFDTIVPPTHLVWQFFGHMTTNCVDFPSLCALRCQLPVSEREVILNPIPCDYLFEVPERAIYVHAGRHWPSKTFPKEWWDRVIGCLLDLDVLPVLIGADTDDNRGTVDVETSCCLDLRNKMTIPQSIYMLQKCKGLITNDSSPLHMAASRRLKLSDSPIPWISYVATCKHPDYITHWRSGQWGYRMKNFGKSGIWDLVDYCPNKEQEVTAENVDENILRSWLPDPEEIATETVRQAFQPTN